DILQQFAAVIHPTVPALGYSECGFKLKVAGGSPLPDDKRIVLQIHPGLDLTHQVPALDPPQTGIPFPSCKTYSIKNTDESRFQGARLRGILLLAAAALGCRVTRGGQ